MIESAFETRSEKKRIPTNESGGQKMVRRKKYHFLLGVVAGIIIGWAFLEKCELDPVLENTFHYSYQHEVTKSTPHNGSGSSENGLLFVGVMTAQQFLKTRAVAVYHTWGRQVPGNMAFFSSEGSRAPGLPLVALPGVDDSYPPQKKSFLMLLYMHDNFIDKYEWFLRADDDLYIRMDRLEQLLRSVDSRRAQFIGQAGRGNNREFGYLSLEYNENFCMGGPGVILSRETLLRMAPHIKECLQNLYTTHEDVELGRCVQKYAGVPCTWSYEMQSILYHNSSGNLSYTGNLKKKEVHQAITLHPVKDYRNMYRIHTYLKNLKIQDLKETSISLHRDISVAARELSVNSSQISSYKIADGLQLFPNSRGSPKYLGDTNIFGVAPNLNRYYPRDVRNVLSWNFISKVVFSPENANPKRKMEIYIKEALEDNIRELMENINAFSKQRGRVIEFKEILYGYYRLDPIHGADYIVDILLVYKKYRGRKMTVPVRRHGYLQQSFNDIQIREISMSENQIREVDDSMKKRFNYDVDNVYPQEYSADTTPYISFLNFKKLNIPIKEVLQTGIMKISNNLPMVFSNLKKQDNYLSKEIKFVLPLSGRYETFSRFMKMYEDICIIGDGKTTLIVSLFRDPNNPHDFEKTVNLINFFNRKYPNQVLLIETKDAPFSRGVALSKGVLVCGDEDLLFFVDVDILIKNRESLRRIRMNTARKRQVYFPIVFSEYDSSVINDKEYNVIYLKNKKTNNVTVMGDHVHAKLGIEDYGRDFTSSFVFSDDSGYFRQFGYGIMSVYKSDFSFIGGFNTDIKGWGLEDVDLFGKFVQSNVSIFRAIDSDMVHVFHPVDCDKNLELDQYNMCIGTKASTFASVKQMTIFLFNHPKIIPKVNSDKTVDDKPINVPSNR